MVGVPPSDAEISIPMGSLFTDRRLIGSSAGTGRPRVDFPWYIDMYLQGRLKLEELQSNFRPLEEIKTLWDEHNPCLILVKPL